MRNGHFQSLLLTVSVTLFLAECKHLIYVCNFPPLSICKEGLSKNASDFKGIEIELFKNVTKRLNWSEADYEFRCLGNANLTEWADNSSSDDYFSVIGGLAISYDFQNRGYEFSLPTFDSGLSILVLREKDPWSMVKVFTFNIALLIVGSALFMGVLHFFLEEKQNPLETYVWSAFGNLFFCNQIPLKKFSSKVILASFWFMVLIVQSTLTANLVNLNSSNNLGINSVSNLFQKKVKVPEEFSDLLLSYGAKPVPPQVGHDGFSASARLTEDMIKEDLRREDSDRVDAICVEDFLAAEISYKTCDIAVVSRVFEPIKYAMLFSKNASKALRDAANLAIKQQTEEQTSFFLLNSYLYQSFVRCAKDIDEGKIDYQDVKGLLFIILGAAGVGVLIFLFSMISCSRRLSLWMESLNILEKSDEGDQRLTGDELIVQNLRQATMKTLKEFESQIVWRLEDLEGVVEKYVKNGGYVGRTEKLRLQGENSFDFNLKTREEFAEVDEIEKKMKKEFKIRRRKF